MKKYAYYLLLFVVIINNYFILSKSLDYEKQISQIDSNKSINIENDEYTAYAPYLKNLKNSKYKKYINEININKNQLNLTIKTNKNSSVKQIAKDIEESLNMKPTSITAYGNNLYFEFVE